MNARRVAWVFALVLACATAWFAGCGIGPKQDDPLSSTTPEEIDAGSGDEAGFSVDAAAPDAWAELDVGGGGDADTEGTDTGSVPEDADAEDTDAGEADAEDTDAGEADAEDTDIEDGDTGAGEDADTDPAEDAVSDGAAVADTEGD